MDEIKARLHAAVAATHQSHLYDSAIFFAEKLLTLAIGRLEKASQGRLRNLPKADGKPRRARGTRNTTTGVESSKTTKTSSSKKLEAEAEQQEEEEQ